MQVKGGKGVVPALCAIVWTTPHVEINDHYLDYMK